MGIDLAKALDGIPVVATSTDRDTRYPTPSTNQRVYRLDSGNIELWTGAAWSVAVPGQTTGTWTPTLLAQSSGTITLGGGTSDAKAYVSRQNNVVTVWGRLAVASVASPTGNLLIGNLPYMAANDPANSGPVDIRATGMASGAATALQGYVSPGATTIVLETFSAGTAGTAAGVVQAGTVFFFRATYMATALP